MPWWKRCVDIVGGFILIIFTSPIMFLVVLAIKFSSRGPVFFVQERVGHARKVFRMYKFRSMIDGACPKKHEYHVKNIFENGLALCKMDKSDDRLIPFIGKLIRETSIDELPQLFNVVKGDMSLVGPRPCTKFEARYLLDKRFEAKPGLTGLWQVSGKNLNTLKQMIKLDCRYVEELSFLKDLKIIIKTPAALIKIAAGKIY